MQANIIIIGGGIAGASAASFLSQHTSVILLERESVIGYHSSARTAGLFTVGIYAETMRRLAQASRSFLENPTADFAPYPLLNPRGCLTVGRADQSSTLEKVYDYVTSVGAEARFVDVDEALRLCPVLKKGSFVNGVHETGAMDIDVDLLLQGYVRKAKASNAQFITDVNIAAITKKNGMWAVKTQKGDISAPMILNAAGAWVDEVTRLAGIDPVGITPCRRTAFTFAGPEGVDVSRWPYVSTADYNWYFKPEGGGLMGSLADTVPTSPSDVYPDDLDVAQGIYNIEQATNLHIKKPSGTWAGLRSFATDKNPVAGTPDATTNFYILAGQGGCGVLTSPALGQAITAIMLEQELPKELKKLGITKDALSPARPTLQKNSK